MAAKVWIIDDDESVRDVLTAIVSEIGYDARSFRDPKQALESFQPGCADVVITDLRMPGMNGLELIRAMIKKDPMVLIMVLTGFPTITDAVDAIRSGAVDFLSKPCRIEEIRIRIERALQGRMLRDRLNKNRFLTWILIGSMPLWFVLGLLLGHFLNL